MQKNLTPQQVLDLAVKKEERVIQIPFTQSEREEVREQYVQNSLILDHTKKEFAEVATGYRKLLKEQGKTVSENLADINNGYRESKEEVFLIDDQDEGTMGFYTASGVLVDYRPLRVDERTTKNMFSINNHQSAGGI